ncbi:MAG: hypothetical protein M1114_05845 [Candidatus Dependentiae bacterium]|nr:hypothetical protein [Candidatus Dependentiae bacterium]
MLSTFTKSVIDRYSFLFLLALVNAYCAEHIIYSPEEIQQHKSFCIKKMSNDPKNLSDPSYQMKRAIRTILGNDCDYIPKVVGAGEIFYEGTIPYQLMHNGVKIHLNCYYECQWLTDVMYGLKGHHEPQEEKCFFEVLKYMPEGATMIELGAYWAYYSLWFNTHVKNAKNYLIEPDPKRLVTGEKNFELNNKIGSFKRGFVGKMKDHEPNIDGAEWISIDDFIEQNNIQHINILHADIQGAETEMLETTIKYLDRIDYFFISTHGDTCHLPCLTFFKEHDYIILAEHNHYQSCSGDGLIVAKRKNAAGPDHIAIERYQ